MRRSDEWLLTGLGGIELDLRPLGIYVLATGSTLKVEWPTHEEWLRFHRAMRRAIRSKTRRLVLIGSARHARLVRAA